MGHSWGGQVTARYLLQHPNAVDAWVPVAGAMMVGDDLYVPYRRDFVCRVAAQQAQQHPQQNGWPEMLDWCDKNQTVEPDSPQKDELWTHLDVIYEKLSGEPPLSVGPLLGAVFGSMYNPIDAFRDAGVSDSLLKELHNQDLVPQLEALTLPTLVVSGEYDDLIPAELGEDVLDALGTPPDQKTHRIIEGGSHYPFDATPFNDAVLTLIDTL